MDQFLKNEYMKSFGRKMIQDNMSPTSCRLSKSLNYSVSNLPIPSPVKSCQYTCQPLRDLAKPKQEQEQSGVEGEENTASQLFVTWHCLALQTFPGASRSTSVSEVIYKASSSHRGQGST